MVLFGPDQCYASACTQEFSAYRGGRPAPDVWSFLWPRGSAQSTSGQVFSRPERLCLPKFVCADRCVWPIQSEYIDRASTWYACLDVEKKSVFIRFTEFFFVFCWVYADTTQVGPLGGGVVNKWCWCQRTKCRETELFMTLPTYFARHGFATAGVGKIFHPDACTRMHQPDYLRFSHRLGDDHRAWNHGEYGVEGRLQEPFDRVIVSQLKCTYFAGVHTLGVHCVSMMHTQII